MKIETLKDLLHDELKDLWSAENQVTEALPKMIEAVTNDELREALHDHLEVTRAQRARIEQISDSLDWDTRGHKCKGMEGVIAEGQEFLENDLPGDVLDAAIIGAAQRVEHYEIAAYGTARSHAEKVGLQDAANELQKTLDEEKAADERLTQLAERSVNVKAMAE